MQRMMSTVEALRRLVRKAGPYLVLEILLPGGTMFALLLFLHRSGKLNFGDLFGFMVQTSAGKGSWENADDRGRILGKREP